MIEDQKESQGEQAKRPRSPYRLMLWAGAGLLGLAALLVAALAFIVFVKPQFMEPALVRAVNALGYQASYDALRVSVSPPSVMVSGLAVVSSGWEEGEHEAVDGVRFSATADSARLVLDMAAGFDSGVWVDSLEVENPLVVAFVGAGRESDRQAGLAVTLPAVFRRLRITGGQVTAHLPGGEVRATDVQARIGAPGEDLDRTFTARAGASFKPSGETMIQSVAFRADAQGRISPGGALSLEVRVSDGRVHGAATLGFSGGAQIEARGDTLTARQAMLTVTDLSAGVSGLPRFEAASLDLRLAEAVLEKSVELDLTNVALDLTGLALSISESEPLELATVGLLFPDAKVVLDEPSVTASDFSMTIPQLIGLRADAMAGRDQIEMTVHGTIDSLTDVLDEAGTMLPSPLRAFSLAGELPFSASVSGGWDAPGVALTVRPDQVRVGRAAEPALDLSVSGTVSLSGPLAGPLGLSGEMAASGAVTQGDLAISGARARAVLGGSVSAPGLTDVRVSVPGGGLSFSGTAPPLGDVSARAARVALEGQRLAVRGLSVTSSRLGGFTGQAGLRLDAPDLMTAKLSAAGLDMAVLYGAAQEAGFVQDPLQDPIGRLDVQASLVPEQGEQRVKLEAGFKGLSFTADQGGVLAGELAGELGADFALAEPRNLAVELAVNSGEALLDTYYMDFGAYPTQVSVQGEMHGPRDFRDFTASVAMQGIGQARVTGAHYKDVSGVPEFAGRLVISEPDLPTALQVFVKEPLAFARPDLAGLTAQGFAELACDFAGRGETLDVFGVLGFKDLDFAYPAQDIIAEGVNLELPFAHRLGALADAPASLETADWGRLSWDGVALPTGVMPAGSLGVAVARNALLTRGNLAVPLPGGSVTLGPIRVDEPLSPDYVRLSTSATLDSLNLADLPTDVVPLTGSLAGDFPDITATSEELRATGQVLGGFFGGELTASDFVVIRPFSAGRVLGLDALEVTGIELEPLSQALDIGRITGILDVSVRNYRQAFGQPVAFDLTARSRKISGVSQRVSLKAVNAISVMGTGSGLGDVGVGMFAGFFEEFGYDAMGISASLENDVFRVRGLIRQGGVEYLIKKPLLFGINVINRNPDNRISFTDMMERVQRVVGGGAEEDNASPKEES